MNTPDSTRVEVTEALLADIEAKARAATPGPWVGDEREGMRASVYSDDATGSVVAECGSWSYVAHSEAACIANAAFILSAQPAVVLALVQRIKDLESAKEVVAQARLLRSVTCERCGKPFLPQGLGAHRRRCLARSRP